MTVNYAPIPIPFVTLLQLLFLLFFILWLKLSIRITIIYCASESAWSSNHYMVNSKNFWESSGMYLLLSYVYWPQNPRNYILFIRSVWRAHLYFLTRDMEVFLFLSRGQ